MSSIGVPPVAPTETPEQAQARKQMLMGRMLMGQQQQGTSPWASLANAGSQLTGAYLMNKGQRGMGPGSATDYRPLQPQASTATPNLLQRLFGLGGR